MQMWEDDYQITEKANAKNPRSSTSKCRKKPPFCSQSDKPLVTIRDLMDQRLKEKAQAGCPNAQAIPRGKEKTENKGLAIKAALKTTTQRPENPKGKGQGQPIKNEKVLEAKKLPKGHRHQRMKMQGVERLQILLSRTRVSHSGMMMMTFLKISSQAVDPMTT